MPLKRFVLKLKFLFQVQNSTIYTKSVAWYPQYEPGNKEQEAHSHIISIEKARGGGLEKSKLEGMHQAFALKTFVSPFIVFFLSKNLRNPKLISVFRHQGLNESFVFQTNS